jgi:hypothetical protein
MLAGGIAASIIGATYLWPAGAVIPYRAKSRWFVMSVIVATVIMAASLLVIPSMLVYTTAAFVVVTAASGAVLVPRTVKSILVK